MLPVGPPQLLRRAQLCHSHPPSPGRADPPSLLPAPGGGPAAPSLPETGLQTVFELCSFLLLCRRELGEAVQGRISQLLVFLSKELQAAIADTRSWSESPLRVGWGWLLSSADFRVSSPGKPQSLVHFQRREISRVSPSLSQNPGRSPGRWRDLFGPGG